MTTTESFALWLDVWPELEADGGVTWEQDADLDGKLPTVKCSMSLWSEDGMIGSCVFHAGVHRHCLSHVEALRIIREHIREKLLSAGVSWGCGGKGAWGLHDPADRCIGGFTSYDEILIAGFRWLRAQMPQDATEARTKKHDMTQKLI